MSYNKPQQKKDDKNELRMSEICKGLNKFRKLLEGNRDQFGITEFTLRDIVRMGIKIEMIRSLGAKAPQGDTSAERVSVEMSEEIPREGVLISVIKENKRFKVTIKNTQGQIETYSIPEKAVKLEFNWQH